MSAFKPGLFLVAVEASLPVVPVVVISSRHVMLKGRLMTCPGEVEVVVHEPIQTQDLTRHDVRILADRVHGIISKTVQARDPLFQVRSQGFQHTSAAAG